MKRPTVTLLVPILNEIEGMKMIMPQIQKDWCDQILVVDGQSSDGSAEYAQAQGWDVIVQKKRGIRHAYLESFPHIKGEIVITFSPDGNSIPEAIPQLVSKMAEGYDMVIASRYATGAHSDDDDFLTTFGNWFFTSIISLFHGFRYTDAMVMYRAYRTKLFYELDLDKENAYAPEKLLCTVIGVEPLLSIRAAKRKMKISEIPAVEPVRIGSERKLQPFRWGGAYLLQVFRELYYWK